MSKLIITADDYGMSPAVNQGIIEGIEAGLITTTNVMTNMDYLDNRQELTNLKGKVSIGLHWCISVGFPVSDKDKVSSLLDEKTGKFLGYKQFVARYKKGLIKDEEIKTELACQYNKFIELFGFEPDYWNTHQNTHVGIGIYDLFVDTAKELGIFKMRNHQRIYVKASSKSSRSLKWHILEIAKRRIIDKWQKESASKGMSFPDGVIVNMDKKDKLNLKFSLPNICWKKSSIAEFVIHPATSCDCEYFGNISDKRIEEYHTFTNPDSLKVIKDSGIQLVNFSQI